MILKATLFFTALVLSFGCGKKTEDISKKGPGFSQQTGKKASSEDLATESLFNAIDDIESIMARVAIKQGARINEIFPNGETPLTMALKKSMALKVNKTSLVRAILEAQADVDLPNLKSEHPIHLAIQHEDRSFLNLLLTNNVNINVKNRQGQTPLLVAITNEDELTALQLVKMGAKLKCRDQYGFTALELSEKMNYSLLSRLIKDALEVESNGLDTSSITRYITRGDDHFLEYLLRNHSLKKLSNGLNPLSLAINIQDAYHRQKTIKLFLRHGFNPDGEPKDTKVPLSEAIKKGDTFAFNTLLLNRANPNLRDAAYRTPLIYAVEELSLSMVEKLVYYQAKKTYEYDRENFTYIMSACRTLPDPGFFMFRNLTKEERKKRDDIKKFLGCL